MEHLRKIWLEEETHAFSGWDFSHIDERYANAELPWDYRAAVLDGLLPAHRLLDMGTGGGEFLMTLGHPPAMTSVTEGYPPNLALCKERLEPLGVEVCGADGGDPLPFETERFDRVINRHESFRADEIERVLKPGGLFVTQQVGGENDRALSKRLIPDFVPAFPDHDLVHNVRALTEAGLEVLRAEEHFGPIRFFDTGALVFFAKVIPWEFPEFSVERSWERLLGVQREIERRGYVEATEHRFLIVAQKKA